MVEEVERWRGEGRPAVVSAVVVVVVAEVVVVVVVGFLWPSALLPTQRRARVQRTWPARRVIKRRRRGVCRGTIGFRTQR